MPHHRCYPVFGTCKIDLGCVEFALIFHCFVWMDNWVNCVRSVLKTILVVILTGLEATPQGIIKSPAFISLAEQCTQSPFILSNPNLYDIVHWTKTPSLANPCGMLPNIP